MKKILKTNRGISLLIVVMVMVLLLSMTGASLMFTSINFRSVNNLRLSTAALQAADAGVQHALALVPSDLTFSYSSSTTLVNAYSFASGYSYTVTALNDSASSGGNTRAILTSTATGPNGTQKVVIAYLARDTAGGTGQGTVYIPGLAPNIETDFGGNSFTITGNDTNYDGTAGPGAAVPGISVTDSALQTEITNNTTSDGGLASNQMNNVTGAGGSPSVSTTTTMAMTPTQIADAFLAHPHTDLTGDQTGGTWGTDSVPQVTQINGNTKITGNPTGSGVLIVDGTLEIAGTLTFHGLIIARGPVQVNITGNVHIYGGFMLAESTSPDGGNEFKMQGNGSLYYSSQAYTMLNTFWSGVLPQPAKMVAWQERFGS
jgi:Tfp pilus assembly protein PilX